jgi:hypothetical protein
MYAESILKFPKTVQLKHVATELMRARNAERQHKTERAKSSLERALALIDTLLHDPKWRDNLRLLLLFREEIAKAYLGNQDAAAVLKHL